MYVLEGSYNLESCNLDDHAKNEGWFKDAETVGCQQDIIDFILRHGGKCELIYNSKTDFIIGGSIADARVANHRRAIEAATVNTLKANRKHKEHLKKVADMGVIKWTFLFRVIHHIFDEAQENKILRETATIFRPRRHDFLVLSKIAEESFLNKENAEELTGVGLKLALDEVGKDEVKVKIDGKISTKKGMKSRRILLPPQLSWQYRGLIDLEEDEKWVLEGPRQHFWRRNVLLDGRTHVAMVLYPDLFDIGDFGFSNGQDVSRDIHEGIVSIRWNAIPLGCTTSQVASVLPLAKAMGARVTAHLHDGVTHILCELKDSSILQWDAHVPQAVFMDGSRGTALQSRLVDLDLPKSQRITLVSPTWIRQHWCKHKH